MVSIQNKAPEPALFKRGDSSKIFSSRILDFNGGGVGIFLHRSDVSS